MGELARLAAGFYITPARRGRHDGNAYGFDQFVFQKRGFQRARREIFDREVAKPGRTSQPNFGAERGQGRNPIRRGVGVRERAADRAPVANGAVGDSARDPPHRIARDVGNPPVLDVAMRDAGADHELVAAPVGVFEFGKAGNVDDQIRLDQAEVEHRAERLPAGHDLGGALGFCHQGDRRIQACRPLIGEGCGFHACRLSRASSTASTSRRGEIGECRSLTPSGRSASFTALVIAAGGAMAPPSPIPLTPNMV